MALAAVRRAAVTDVADIVRIQAVTWAAAYAELVPAAALEQLDGTDARQAWIAAIAAGEGHHVFVATEGDWRVGYTAVAAGAAGKGATGAPEGPELGPGAWAEIGALLVEPRWGRRGHGGRLLAAAAAALRGNGARYGLAWLPESDAPSRGFYAHAGWEPDGAVRALDTGDGILREIRVTGSLDLKLEP